MSDPNDWPRPTVKLLRGHHDLEKYTLLGLCLTALHEAGQADRAAELMKKFLAAPNDQQARDLLTDYCETE